MSILKINAAPPFKGLLSSVGSDIKGACVRISELARVDIYCQSGLIVIATVCCVLLSLDIALRFSLLFESDAIREFWRTGDFRLDRRHSYPELAEYTLMSFAGFILLATSVRTATIIYGLFGMIGIYLALDNVFGLHGSLGHIAGVGHFWSERLYLVMVAIPILGLLTAGVFRTKPSERGLAWLILGTLFLFVIFAGGVDAVNAVHSRFPVPIAVVEEVVDHFLDVLEDGGELVATGLFAATALATFRLSS